MTRPPSTRTAQTGIAQFVVAVALVAVTVVTGAPAAAAPGAWAPTASGTPSPSVECDGDYYEPPELSFDWSPTYEDGLPTDSLADWSGGRTAHVGAGGQCSLVVTRNRSATLTAAAVEGARGIVTGTLDLGADGQLRLVTASGAAGPETSAAGNGTGPVTSTGPGEPATATAGPSTPTTDGTAADAPTTSATPTGAGPALVVTNRGRDFSTRAVATVGDRSVNLTLPSGHFFEFAVRRTTDGGVQVAVWRAGERWDGTWDARFADAGSGDWRVRLRGRAFLDGVAVGTAESATATTGAGADPAGDSDGRTETADSFPGAADPDFEGGSELEEPQADTGGSDAGSVFLGLVLIGAGAVGFRYAYELTRFGEQMDAIGSTTRASEVEPADWNVMMSKVVAAVIAVVGVFLVIGGLQ